MPGFLGAGTSTEDVPGSNFAFPSPQLGGGMTPVVREGSRKCCAGSALNLEARCLRSLVLIFTDVATLDHSGRTSTGCSIFLFVRGFSARWVRIF